MYKYNPEQTFEDGDIYQNPVEDNNETTGRCQMEKEAPQERILIFPYNSFMPTPAGTFVFLR